MATSAQVFKLLVIVKDNGPSQDYYHLDDQTTRPCDLKKNMLCIFERGRQRETQTVSVYTPNTNFSYKWENVCVLLNAACSVSHFCFMLGFYLINILFF